MKRAFLLFTTTLLLATGVIAQQAQNEETVRPLTGEEDVYVSSESAEARAFYQAAYEMFYNKDFRGAINNYATAVKIDPGFIDAIDNLGLSYRHAGKLDSAEYWYNKSIELYPQGIMARQNLAYIYMGADKIAEAAELYKVIIKLDPKDPEGFFGLANVSIQLEDYKTAEKQGKKALALYADNHPYRGDAAYVVGLAYYFQNKEKPAKKYFIMARKMGVKLPGSVQKFLE